jgi:hypothetical protein
MFKINLLEKTQEERAITMFDHAFSEQIEEKVEASNAAIGELDVSRNRFKMKLISPDKIMVVSRNRRAKRRVQRIVTRPITSSFSKSNCSGRLGSNPGKGP